MKIIAATVADAASDPKHPDHDAWVKDRTLRMEVEHAKRVGIPLRVAESENQRLLERSARIARETPKAKKPKRKRLTQKESAKRYNDRVERENIVGRNVDPPVQRDLRHLRRGIRKIAARPEVPAAKLSPCGRCGVCRACMRERRVLKIIQKSRTGDEFMRSLILELTATLMNAMRGIGKFRDVTPDVSDRMVEMATESVCDRSIRWLGEWR